MAPTVTAIDLGPLHIDFVRRVASYGGAKPVPLCHREMVLLYHLARSRHAVPTPKLTALVFGADGPVQRNRLYAAVGYLKRGLPGAIVAFRHWNPNTTGWYGLAGLHDEPEEAA